MKRIGNLYNKICSPDNLQQAAKLAAKGKSSQAGVIKHQANQDAELLALHNLLLSKSFTTSPYKHFKIHEPKEREISSLPFYPDRIVHHAIMLVLEPILYGLYTADTYNCIKGRGIMGLVRNIKAALKDKQRTTYCLKLDIKKFYPSIDHEVLKVQLARKFKDNDLLDLLYNIIDSAPGLPIGNLLSQYFANLYLTGFDHWIKETKKVKYYFRYADDIVILSDSKEQLHSLLSDIKLYLGTLKLTVKENYQVFPVAARGIDVGGYVFYHNKILLRKSIKKRFARLVTKPYNPQALASYMGWASHCNSKHLVQKLTSTLIISKPIKTT